MLNTTYLIWMGASVLAAGIVHYFLTGSLKMWGLLTALTLVLGTVLGALFARLGYCLLQFDYAMALWRPSSAMICP